MQKPRNFWTKEKCKEEALKYIIKKEFQYNSCSAYESARKNKWLDEICSHMKSNKHWNFELCQKEALKYLTKKEFKEKSGSAYGKACTNKWIDEICQHMKISGTLKKRCIYAAEFPDNYVYVGLTFSIENRIQRHLNDKKSSIYKHIQKTGIQPKFKQITDYIEINNAAFEEGNFVEYYRKLNWNILNCSKTGTIGGNEIYWTKEKCQKEALKYNSKLKFFKISKGAYQAARRNNWLNEICSHMDIKWRYWTKEKCQKEALKYSTRKSFSRKSGGAHCAAKRNGWFDEICCHMKPVKLKRTIEECRIEALKYKTRYEFNKQSSGAYKSALRYKILDEICQHMPKNVYKKLCD